MNLIFVSAGLTRPKKADTRVGRRHRYLNYGLLSLANSVSARDASVFHGHFDPPAATLDRVRRSFDTSEKTVFLLSCPSFLAMEWTTSFVRDVRRTCPKAVIILGGRWVVDGNVERLASMLPEVDRFVEGLGEPQIADLLDRTGVDYRLDARASETFSGNALSFLNYRKLDRPEQFVPSFEVSRGCGAGCAFCSESNVKMTAMKPPALLAAEILDYDSAMAADATRFYLESSLFVPRRDWIDSWQRERQASGLQDRVWRTEARVDMFAPRNVGPLADAGLRVLDLGLESASPTQLLRMRKTSAPLEYIRRCEELLREAKAAGILTKVNILLFPGESRETLDETYRWLERNASYVTGVSVYPTVYYGFNKRSDPLWNYYVSLGASEDSSRSRPGITMLNLSDDFTSEEAENVSEEIAGRFMSVENRFALKSFSYFDPSYSYSQYLEDVEEDSRAKGKSAGSPAEHCMEEVGR